LPRGFPYRNETSECTKDVQLLRLTKMKQEELNEKKAKRQRIEDDQAGNITGGRSDKWDALVEGMI